MQQPSANGRNVLTLVLFHMHEGHLAMPIHKADIFLGISMVRRPLLVKTRTHVCVSRKENY